MTVHECINRLECSLTLSIDWPNERRYLYLDLQELSLPQHTPGQELEPPRRAELNSLTFSSHKLGDFFFALRDAMRSYRYHTLVLAKVGGRDL